MSNKNQSGSTLAPRTQAGRRVAYGLNVVIATVIALAIVGVVNYIGYNYLFSYRKDMTATGEYSLSPQSRKILQSTEQPVHIVSLFSGSTNPMLSERIRKARGLVDEYGRVTGKVTVQHIDPASEPSRLDAFYQSLRQRFEDQIKPMDAAVTDGLEAVRTTQQTMQAMVRSFDELLNMPAMPQGKLPETLVVIKRVVGQQEADFGQYQSQIQKAMDRPLPDYSGAVTTVKTLLEMIDKQLFARSIQLLEPFVSNPNTPDAIKNQLLKSIDQFIQARAMLKPQLERLQSFEPLAEYDKLYAELVNPNVVVLVGQSQVTVVALEQMFRVAANTDGSGVAEPQFLGEEKITGALLGMQQQVMPMVVFVSNPQYPAFGQQGLLRLLGERLENMRFRVEEWSPQGRPGPMGQMLPAGDPPKPLPGQKTVWVVLPMASFNPMMPMQTGGSERVLSLIQERTMAGDGVMVILNYAQGARVGVPDPLALWAQEWGIHAMNDRLIMREIVQPNRTKIATIAHVVNQWPDALPITRALSGFSGLFSASSPLELTQSTDQDETQTQVWPLVEVRGQNLWAERDPKEDSKRPAEGNKDAYIVAAAAKRDQSRLVLVADPAWVTDQIAGRADFPGNAELFVNSVYWLSDLEQMIAASARTQDIRRIGSITPQNQVILRWLMMLGMPLIVTAAGVGVWMVRRRG